MRHTKKLLGVAAVAAVMIIGGHAVSADTETEATTPKVDEAVFEINEDRDQGVVVYVNEDRECDVQETCPNYTDKDENGVCDVQETCPNYVDKDENSVCDNREAGCRQQRRKGIK